MRRIAHMRSLQLHNIINLGAMTRCSLKRMQVLTLFSSLLAKHSKPPMKGKDQLCCSHRDAVMLYSSTWLPLWVVKRRSSDIVSEFRLSGSIVKVEGAYSGICVPYLEGTDNHKLTTLLLLCSGIQMLQSSCPCSCSIS